MRPVLLLCCGLIGTACARSDFGALELPTPTGDSNDGGDSWLASRWYDADWAWKKDLTIHASEVSEDLTDFVLLVAITDAEVATHAQVDAEDLVFTSADGEDVLAFEIEAYEPTTGDLVAWVLVPHVAAAQDTILSLYYGNPAASDQQDAAATFSAPFRGVWHLDQTPTVDLNARDSTANANAGTFIGGMVPEDQVTGAMAGSLDLDGVDDHVRVADADSLTLGDGAVDSAVTISTWALMRDASAFKVVTKGISCCPGVEYYLRTGDQTDDFLWMRFYDAGSYIGRKFTAPMTPYEGQWIHLATTYDGSSTAAGIRLYLNGARVDDADASGGGAYTAMENTTSDVYIGTYTSGTTYNANGRLDELRILDTERSAGWIESEYRNQSAPAQFLSVSAGVMRP